MPAEVVKMTKLRGRAQRWLAECTECANDRPRPGIPKHWTGYPMRTRRDAQLEADAHNGWKHPAA